MNGETMVFTAAQIARGLGVSPRRARQMLAATKPTKETVRDGLTVKTWTFSALPGVLQTRINEGAVKQGFRNGEHRLRSDEQPWMPSIAGRPVAWAEIAEPHRLKALERREVIRPILTATTEGEAIERENQACAKLQLSRRHLERVIERTLERDRGSEAFDRAEIYLDDNISRADQTMAVIAMEFRLPDEITETIRAFENSQAPTREDMEDLWDQLLRHCYEIRQTGKRSERAEKTRKLLQSALAAVPQLGKNLEAVERAFYHKLPGWLEHGRSALRDNRRLWSGRFRTPDLEEDENKIKQTAIVLKGNEALAQRMLRQKGELSEEWQAHHKYDERRNKSYVPKTTREEITPDVDRGGAVYRSKSEARMKGPSIPRDWSDTEPLDYFSGDDVTWNSYFYYYDEDGKYQITRGECLVLADLRTGYPIAYKLIAGRYNGRHIRSLILHGHDRIGLPNKGFYPIENSIWKSRYADISKDALHFRETERGLGGLGENRSLIFEPDGAGQPVLNLAVRHAKPQNPRTKPIEGVFRIAQERMRVEKGFVGFNERDERMEQMQHFLGRANRRTVSRWELEDTLPSMEWWNKRIGTVLMEVADEPQNGEMLDGLSPTEAFQQKLKQTPARKLHDHERYILATHSHRLKVREEGIVLTVGGERMVYCNDRTGDLINKEVLIFYNVDDPGLLTVSDVYRQSYFSVRRIKCNATTATSEELNAANAQIAAHMKPAKVMNDGLVHRVRSWIVKDSETTEETKALGRFHNEEIENHKVEQSAGRRKTNALNREAAALGVSIAGRKNPELVLEGARLEQEAQERRARKRAAQQAEGQA